MHPLSRYRFGYADAATEFRREPDLLETAFYYPDNVIEELRDGFKFLLVGRKGTGKTAVASKIRLTTANDPTLVTKHLTLAQFEYKTFSKLGSSDESGGFRFLVPWKMLLLLQAAALVRDLECAHKSPSFWRLVKGFERASLIPNGSISRVVRTVSKPGFRVGVSGIGDVQVNAKEEELILSDPEHIAEVTLEEIEALSFGDVRLLVIVDGLDDALRFKDRQLDIIAGLIRAASDLNDRFYECHVPIKYVVLCRPDVLAQCNDPDLNKIQCDSEVELSWHRHAENPGRSPLMQLVKLRLGTAEPWLFHEEPWYEIFPRTINDKDSWKFVLEHTMLRPRDLLQFLIVCQKAYPDKTCLDEEETKHVLSDYSKKYFLNEMRNELAGFLTTRTINSLTGALCQVGGRTFNSRAWQSVCEQSDMDENPRAVLATLFNAGYIGQVSHEEGITVLHFKYWNPAIQIDWSKQFIVHRGLWKALNIT